MTNTQIAGVAWPIFGVLLILASRKFHPPGTEETLGKRRFTALSLIFGAVMGPILLMMGLAFAFVEIVVEAGVSRGRAWLWLVMVSCASGSVGLLWYARGLRAALVPAAVVLGFMALWSWAESIDAAGVENNG